MDLKGLYSKLFKVELCSVQHAVMPMDGYIIE